MVRFMTGLVLVAFVAAVAGSDIPDPMDVALAATEDATTTIQEPGLNQDTAASNSGAVTPVTLPEPNTAAAISDSISNVMVEEKIDPPESASSPDDNDDRNSDSTSAPQASDPAPSSDSAHVTPTIALVSLTAMTITWLFS